VIKPYQWNGMWVFDDPAVGLVREPFVAGVPQMIEQATADIPEAGSTFLVRCEGAAKAGKSTGGAARGIATLFASPLKACS
jgi:hypothetical protein